MTIEVAKLKDGSLAMLSDLDLPSRIKHIVYYREPRLFELVFHDKEVEEMLVTRELDPPAAQIVESAPEIMVVIMAAKKSSPFGYDVPLIQVGV